jgi:hypothetical protein
LLFYCEPGAFVILMDVIMKDLTLAFRSSYHADQQAAGV